MNDFKLALQFVLSAEGGFSDDANDHGGATNRGILQREYTAWRQRRGETDRSIEEITDEEVINIYMHRYLYPAKCDNMLWPINVVHFDAAVNTGIEQAALFLQRAVDATADGQIGPRTLSALNQSISKDGAKAVAARIANLRRPFYELLAEKDPTQNDFLKGWLNRVDNLATFIDTQNV
jgi:lysozyme family protein